MAKKEIINTAKYLGLGDREGMPTVTAFNTSDYNVVEEVFRGTSPSKIIDRDANNGVEYDVKTFGKEITIVELIKRFHPQAQPFFLFFFTRFIAETKGYTLYVNNTIRTLGNSARLKKLNSENASPGKSAHNYGAAMDFNLKADDGLSLRKSSPNSKWLTTPIPRIGKESGLRWGGEFSSYHDPIHFDVNFNREDAVLGLEKLYGVKLSNLDSIIKKEEKNRFALDGRKVPLNLT